MVRYLQHKVCRIRVVEFLRNESILDPLACCSPMHVNDIADSSRWTTNLWSRMQRLGFITE